jgi:outer membrane protein OmpA-like peptidoglycan-associated protein
MRLWWSSILALVLCSGGAAAQTTAAITFERFSPTIDGKGLFSAESADTLEQWQPYVSVVPHYERDPLRQRGTRLSLLSQRLTADFSVAVGLLRWLEVGMNLPLVLVNERGTATGAAGGLLGPGPMRFGMKLRLANEADHGVGFALAAFGSVPVGAADAFLTEDNGVFSPSLLIEKHFSAYRVIINLGLNIRKLAAYRSIQMDDEIWWRLAFGWRPTANAEVGVEFNGATPVGNSAGDFLGDAPNGNPLEALFGFKYYFSGGAQFMIGAGPGLNPAVGTPIFRVFAGFGYAPGDKDTDGDGVYDKQDRCPAEPGPRENQGCPWPDTDHDGVPDNTDKCPTQAGPKRNEGCPVALDRDGDGIDDKDDRCPLAPGPRENQGCPWPDRDKDGVLDKDDKCPDAPGPADNQGCPKKAAAAPSDRDSDGVPDSEDKCPDKAGPKENQGCPWPDRDSDGVADKDDDCPDQAGTTAAKGCPEKGPRITKTDVAIDGRIQFRVGRSTIRRGASRQILDEIAALLIKFPGIKKVEVGGHTDDTGDANANRRLAERRARAVRRYLIKKGVAKDRLVAKGYGEDKPVVPVDEAKMSQAELNAARTKNRRVEFKVLERD